MSDEQTLEAIVGGLALDLIGAIKPAMEGEGDAAEERCQGAPEGRW